jgi:hypothetical protein
MIEYSIANGEFSNALAIARNISLLSEPEKIYDSLTLMLETKQLLRQMPISLSYPAQATADTLVEQLKNQFLNQAVALYENFWTLSKSSRKSYTEKILIRFKALHILDLAIMVADNAEHKKVFETIREKQVRRLCAFNRTVKNTTDEGEGLWAQGHHELAISVIQAGIVWHESANISMGTDILKKQLQDYTRQESLRLMERASAAQNSEAAERFAVRGLKTFALSHGVNSAQARKVWEYAQANLALRLACKCDKDPNNMTLDSLNEKHQTLKNDFWFLPPTLEADYLKQLCTVEAVMAEYIVGDAQAKNELGNKIACLEKGASLLSQPLPENKPLPVLLSDYRRLEKELNKYHLEIKAIYEKRGHHRVLDLHAQVIEHVATFISGYDEKLNSPVLNKIDVIKQKALNRIQAAQQKLAYARNAADRIQSWYLTTKCLEIYPDFPEVLKYREHIKESVADAYISSSRQITDLHQKLELLNAGLVALEKELPHENKLTQRIQQLSSFKTLLTRLKSSAQIHYETKAYSEVIAAYAEAQQALDQLSGSGQETITAKDLVTLATLRDQAQGAVDKSRSLLKQAENEKQLPRRWLLAIQSLKYDPVNRKALNLKSYTEDELSITGNRLDFTIGHTPYRWFVTESITLARCSGDLPLNLCSVSSFPKTIEIGCHAGRSFVCDRNTLYGVYVKNGNCSSEELVVNQDRFCKISPNKRYYLETPAQIVVGMIGKITVTPITAGVLFQFKKPYSPNQIIPTITETREQLWPDWQDLVSPVFIISKASLTLGSRPDVGIQSSAMGAGTTLLHKQNGNFIIKNTTGAVVVDGESIQTAPVMRKIVYHIGQVPLRFGE